MTLSRRTILAAGLTAPVAACSTPRRRGAGGPVEITDLLTDDLRSKLLPQELGLTTFDDRVFSVPLDIEPMVLHYRADLFERYGLSIPRTWDDFAAPAAEVWDKAPGKKLALFPTDGAMRFACCGRQAGAKWLDTTGGRWTVSLADAPTRKVADYWQRLIDDDLVFRDAGAQPDRGPVREGGHHPRLPRRAHGSAADPRVRPAATLLACGHDGGSGRVSGPSPEERLLERCAREVGKMLL